MTDIKDEFENELQGRGAKNPISREKLKEYSKEAFTPVINLLFKYQDRLTPYLNSITKGLEFASKELQSNESSREDRFIGTYFSRAGDWMKKIGSHLEERDLDKLNRFIKEQSETRPGVAFGSSYLFGFVFTRLIRHSLSGKKEQQPILQ